MYSVGLLWCHYKPFNCQTLVVDNDDRVREHLEDKTHLAIPYVLGLCSFALSGGERRGLHIYMSTCVAGVV